MVTNAFDQCIVQNLLQLPNIAVPTQGITSSPILVFVFSVISSTLTFGVAEGLAKPTDYRFVTLLIVDFTSQAYLSFATTGVQ